MADDKKIRIGVDADAAKSILSNFSKESSQQAEKMIRDARKYTTSVKEVNSYISEQIALIEKRNKLEADKRRSDLERAKTTGDASPEEFKRRSAELKAEISGENTVVKELKAIRSELEQSAKRSVREDRKNVEKQIQASKTVNQLDPKNISGGAAYIESAKQDYLQSLKEDEGIQSGGMQRFLGATPDILGTQNAAQIVSQGLRGAGGMMRGFKGGLIGAIVAGALAKTTEVLAEGVSRVEVSARDYSLLSDGMVSAKGGDMSNMVRRLYKQDIAKYGLKPSDVIGTEYGIRRQAMVSDTGEYGKTDRDAMLRLSLLEKGSFLDQGQISGLVGLRRYGSQATATGMNYYLQQLVRDTDQSQAVTGELASLITNMSMGIAAQTGGVDVSGVTRGTAALSKAGLKGVGLQTGMGALQQGLMRSSNPVIQSMQFKAARQAAGSGASLWDIEKIMADPFSNMGYVENLWNDLKQQTGGGQKFERALGNVFNVNPIMAENFANVDWKNVESPEQLQKKLQRSISYGIQAKEATGELEESAARIGGAKEMIGTATLSRVLDEINEVLKSILGSQEDNFKNPIDEVKLAVMEGNATLEDLEKIQREFHTEQRGTNQQQLDYLEQQVKLEQFNPKGTFDSPFYIKSEF